MLSNRISIHVPREGHDYLISKPAALRKIFQSTCPARGTTQQKVIQPRSPCISIHVPREGHDCFRLIARVCIQIFQSTCPARGTTVVQRALLQRLHHFNPRAPRGARRPYLFKPLFIDDISIHVPREGHDSTPLKAVSSWSRFQSTCPARGTTSVNYTPR